MRKSKLTKLGLAGVLFCSAVQGAYALDFAEEAKVKLELRPRWEYADVKGNTTDAASALTVRIRVGTEFRNLFGTKNLSLFFEPWAVPALVKKYAPENTDYDLIPDPVLTRINQVYFLYKSNNWKLKLGRQIILLDNQRFVGPVGWRQMAQTFDAARFDIKPMDRLNVMVSYIGAKTGITGNKLAQNTNPTAPFVAYNTDLGDDTLVNDSVLLHATYSYSKKGKVVAYAYLLNGLSDTYGLRVSGKPELTSGFLLGYWAEFAYQKDPTLTSHEVTDRKIGAYYYNLNLKPTYRSPVGDIFLEAGYEFMGGADGNETHGFTTPLATLHAQNGWADAFVGYSANSGVYGLVNPVLGAGLKSKKFGNLWVRYHIFKADKSLPGGGKNFGTELDVVYKKKILKNVAIAAKYAGYKADDDTASMTAPYARDITKYWIWLEYRWGS